MIWIILIGYVLPMLWILTYCIIKGNVNLTLGYILAFTLVALCPILNLGVLISESLNLISNRTKL